jgi:hypothetical protein
MDEIVKECWKCGWPFILTYKHKQTGHVFKTCARCHAPFDLSDDAGLKIAEGIPTMREYVIAWKAARAENLKKDE